MPLTPGDRLGPYEILAPIGTGGMGEVYKARDTRLNRIVAVKVSQERFSERFEHEAHAAAALNHPNICALYDVGPNYLVMEFVEGAPVSGPLPLRDALRYAVQIAEALDHAHRRGVVHRDLKPGNILLTKTGAKILDFGLAKLDRAPSRRPPEEVETLPLTQEGLILGTLQYASPEQLQGKGADARSDIFSFGLVLYEMLTGSRAFSGNNAATVIAAILERPAPSLAGYGPPMLDRAVQRCLAKDPDERWQTARDLKADLEWIAQGLSAGSASAQSGPMQQGAPFPATPYPPTVIGGAARLAGNWRRVLPWAVAILLAAALVASTWNRLKPSTISFRNDPVRFSISSPTNASFSTAANVTVPIPEFAMAPDGRTIVFAATSAGKSQLWVRPMGELAAHALPGTDGASQPFWSPDSRWIAFFADGKLKKIPAAGGAVQALADSVPNPRGGSWGSKEVIIFASSTRQPIYRIPENGGKPAAVTQVDASLQEGSHLWPAFLADGVHFLFSIQSPLPDRAGVYVASVNGGAPKLLVRSTAAALFATPNHVLFLDGDALEGQDFDEDRLALTGRPFPIADDIGVSSTNGAAVSVSTTGVLAYSTSLLRLGRLTWFDRAGDQVGAVAQEGDYVDFRLAPDGSRLAASLTDLETARAGIWITDVARGSTSPFTQQRQEGRVLESGVVWSPDGANLSLRSFHAGGSFEIHERSAGGAGEDHTLLAEPGWRATGIQTSTSFEPTDWSSDGRNLLFSADALGSGKDIWRLPLDGDHKPVSVVHAPGDQIHGNFSPDGRLVSYSSNESGRYEVYVQMFPPTDKKWQISTGGGYEPRWRADGREMYYLSEGRKLMAVAVGPGPSFGVPKELFQTQVPEGVSNLRTHYVPARDGQRFLINTQTADAPAASITIVENWPASLKK